MDSFPKISIITPNYNGEKYLEETILSVFQQDYPNLEYIIIDGGSSDGSVGIIKKYEDKLAYWISEPDNGMYDAIQKGFDKSTGEIMAWINSDDMYHRKALFTVADIFSSFQQVNWLSGACTNFDESGRTIFCNQSRLFTKFDFYNHDYKWIQQESVFWRRKLWEQAGACLNTDFKYAGDFELWLRFFNHEKLFVTSALIGGFRYLSAGQISIKHLEEYLNEAEMVLNNVNLTKKEKKILLNYQILTRIELILKKFKVIRTDWFIKRYRSKYFQIPFRIEFNRHSMKFGLLD